MAAGQSAGDQSVIEVARLTTQPEFKTAVDLQRTIWGFADLNRNRSFEPEADVLAAADTVIELTPAQPVVAGLLLHMVNPRAPARSPELGPCTDREHVAVAAAGWRAMRFPAENGHAAGSSGYWRLRSRPSQPS